MSWLPFIFLPWVAIGLCQWAWVYGWLKRYPGDSPDAVQARWNASHRWRMPFGIAVAVLLGASVAYSMFMLPRDLFWRAGLSIIIGQIMGVMVLVQAINLLGTNRVRHTTWGFLETIKAATGLMLTLRSATVAPLVCMLLAQQYMLIDHKFAVRNWFLLTVATWTLVCLGGPVVLRWIGLKLFGARSAPAALQAQFESLVRQADLKATPPLILLPERGGRLPFVWTDGKNVCFSEFLAQTLTREEQDAVLAHELGHMELKHVRRRQRLLLIICAAWMLWIALNPLNYREWVFQNNIAFQFAPYYLFFIMFLRKRTNHKEELEADAYAAKLTGNPEAMSSALETLHQLAILPRKFPGEKVLTHPSLELRLQALSTLETGGVLDEPVPAG